MDHIILEISQYSVTRETVTEIKISTLLVFLWLFLGVLLKIGEIILTQDKNRPKIVPQLAL